jgi:hypothetical protein
MISFQACSDIILIFPHPSTKFVQLKFSHDVYSIVPFFGNFIVNESMERNKAVFISLIRSYIPSD